MLSEGVYDRSDQLAIAHGSSLRAAEWYNQRALVSFYVAKGDVLNCVAIDAAKGNECFSSELNIAFG